MLIDAGPLVSLCDSKQNTHQTCRSLLEAAAMPVVSTWACFVEAMYIVGRINGHWLQQHLWALVERGIVRLHEHSGDEVGQMAALMYRYKNVPMDLADASLVALAEITGDRTLLTLDGDFHVYRFADGGAFTVIPGQP